MEGNKSKFWIGFALAFVIGWGISYFYHTKEVKIEDKRIEKNYDFGSKEELECKKPSVRYKKNNEESATNTNGVPSYALETLEYVLEHHEAPSGYVGGRTFQNREGLLPRDPKYQEWDVHPKKNGQNRGAERLVTSDDGAAYFTSDHYKSFTKIK